MAMRFNKMLHWLKFLLEFNILIDCSDKNQLAGMLSIDSTKTLKTCENRDLNPVTHVHTLKMHVCKKDKYLDENNNFLM